MSVKITYLLGAGASAQALPIVDNLSTSFESMSRYLNSYLTSELSYFPKDEHDIIKNAKENRTFVKDFIEQLNLFSEKHKEFHTIDTYAKYLFITDNKEFKKLKINLSLYFYLHQALFYKILSYEKLDSRYLSLIVSLMSGNELPDDVKFLSWNYDSQIQIAINVYFSKEKFTSTHLGRGSKKIYPCISYWPNLGKAFQIDKISLYHLNGIAGFYRVTGEALPYNDSLFNINENSSNKDIFSNIKEFVDKSEPTIKFAWEEVDLFKDLTGYFDSISNVNPKEDLIDHIKNSNVLIVIGYSFPFFNRKIDKKILDNFNNGDKKIIYFQDPNNDGQQLYEQFDLDRDKIDIKPWKKVDNFFIPHNY